MKESLIVGIDVSKSVLDVCFMPGERSMQITNDQKGFQKWFRQCCSLMREGVEVLVILEHTGQYSLRFERFLQQQGIGYCKIAALAIKRSLGLVRGKTDNIDARRIAEYGWLRREILSADEYPSEQITQLQGLISLRLQLVRTRSMYICRLKEMKASDNMIEEKIHRELIRVFDQKIKQVEQKIKDLLTSHSELEKTAELLRSIKGVGWIVAAHMIVCTQNFKRFRNARKFNCYAGIAPFKHESGSSIKGRARISHLASKETKALLNLAALSAIRFDPEMKAYYQRRVAEGKNKMSCINIIRAKLVARMFAVTKRQTPYKQLAPAA